ncbi:DNA helicase [Pseudomonas phage vB_PaeP_FBPa18]|nr:DNA helicase [Pseudomonas phage vB_PaeP_FBPa18]
MTVGEILALDPEEVRRMYAEKIGGDSELIRIKDFHGGSLAQAEQVIDAMKPAVVFWDMMAHVKGGQRKDQNRTDEMEYKVAEVREMAVRHDFITRVASARTRTAPTRWSIRWPRSARWRCATTSSAL